MRLLLLATVSLALVGSMVAAGDKIEDEASNDAANESANGSEGLGFLHALDNQPIEFEFRPDQEITEAVEHMHATGENVYAGDDAVIEEGKKLYLKYCKACHLKDGKGRIGPSLRDDKWKYDRTGSEKGRFEIIYAGGAGAMQAFGKRIDQDQILKIMAFTDTFQNAE